MLHRLHADVLILIFETSSGLQECKDKLQIYYHKNRLSLNNMKIKVMINQFYF